MLFVADGVFVNNGEAAKTCVQLKLNVKWEARCFPDVVAVQDQFAVAQA